MQTLEAVFRGLAIQQLARLEANGSRREINGFADVFINDWREERKGRGRVRHLACNTLLFIHAHFELSQMLLNIMSSTSPGAGLILQASYSPRKLFFTYERAPPIIFKATLTAFVKQYTINCMKKEAENPENPQLKKEEVRTFEKSIMSGVPKELRFFSLNEGNRTPIGWDMNDRRHDEEEQSSESHSSVMPKLEYPQQEDAMEAEIDPLEGNGNNREDNNEIQAIMKRNKLKNLTKVVYELIKYEGVVHQSQLKHLFLSKFEGANNPLIKATKDNLNRRFYDIRNTLIKNYFIKSRNKNLSITDVVQHKKLDLLRLRRQVSKREKKIQEKRMELNFKQKGKDALKRVTYRNKKMKSSSEKIQSPFFIYLHDQQQYQKLPVRKQDKYTVITINKNMEEIGEFELLEPLSQALKEAADKKSKQIYGE